MDETYEDLMERWRNGRPANVKVAGRVVIRCEACPVPVEAIRFDFVRGVTVSEPCGHDRPPV